MSNQQQNIDQNLKNTDNQVHKIIDRMTEGRCTYYKVWWKGYPQIEATWESKANLQSVQSMLKQYDQRLSFYESKIQSKQPNSLPQQKKSSGRRQEPKMITGVADQDQIKHKKKPRCTKLKKIKKIKNTDYKKYQNETKKIQKIQKIQIKQESQSSFKSQQQPELQIKNKKSGQSQPKLSEQKNKQKKRRDLEVQKSYKKSNKKYKNKSQPSEIMSVSSGTIQIQEINIGEELKNNSKKLRSQKFIIKIMEEKIPIIQRVQKVSKEGEKIYFHVKNSEGAIKKITHQQMKLLYQDQLIQFYQRKITWTS